MTIAPDDLGGDADLGGRVIVYARSIAPCLHDLVDNDKGDAIAILKGALSTAAAITKVRASAVKSRTAGDWSLSYFSDTEIGSVFTTDDRLALRGLCPVAATDGAGPVGSFPEPSRATWNLWPS